MRARTGRLLRAAAALTLAVAAMPLAAGTATASQGGGDEHKVTLCHRTNSENNPYVVITVDKASVFKKGHDSHDEGGVYQSGDKARGVRWGDIIPPFSYYASPQDEQLQHAQPVPRPQLRRRGPGDPGQRLPGARVRRLPSSSRTPVAPCTASAPRVAGTSSSTGSTNDDDGSRGRSSGSTSAARPSSRFPSDGDFEKTIDAPAGTV